MLINGTLHTTPLAVAASLATLRELKKSGVYERLNAWTDNLRREMTKVLRHHSVPALVTGVGSLWHIVFADKPNRNHADSLAADNASLKEFDKVLIRNGVHLLPGGRRIAGCAHGAAELEDTLRAADAAARALS